MPFGERPSQSARWAATSRALHEDVHEKSLATANLPTELQ